MNKLFSMGYLYKFFTQKNKFKKRTKKICSRLEKKETKLCLVTKLCTMVLSIFVYLQTRTKSFVAQHYVVAWFCSVNRVEQKPQREGRGGKEKGLHPYPWVDIPCGPKEPFQWVDQKNIYKMCKLEDFSYRWLRPQNNNFVSFVAGPTISNRKSKIYNVYKTFCGLSLF